jgi:hypothetical protein
MHIPDSMAVLHSRTTFGFWWNMIGSSEAASFEGCCPVWRMETQYLSPDSYTAISLNTFESA